MTALLAAAAVGAGLVGGVFVAFSVAVMPALRSTPAAAGVAMMREVNRVIVGPVFMVLFFGTAVVCVVGVVLQGLAAGWTVAGAALYLVGSFGVTVAFNVPLNNALDARGELEWERYLARWTTWNHVRAVASAAASVALTVAA